MLNHISILLSGFSIFSLLILLIAYLFYLPEMRKSIQGKTAATLLISALLVLQSGHYLFFSIGISLLEYKAYAVLLICIPIAFFFFSRVIVFPDLQYKKIDLLHFSPCLLSLVLPTNYVVQLGFVLGTGYTFWFTFLIFKLRRESHRFKFELFFFALFAVIALITLALCLSLPYINKSIFYTAYSNSIAACILLIFCALLFFPKLLSDLLLITELTYAKSKLNGIDTQKKASHLEQLMVDDKLFQNEDLNLNTLAEQADLSPHQLSELINTHFQCSFSSYVKKHRIQEAKKLLLDNPTSSILTISLMIGFKSQSNFYTSFKEITGISPGKFRKNTE